MDLIISTENDFVLSDCKYVFTKKYPFLMIYFKDEEDWEIDDTKLFSEILKKDYKMSTLVMIQQLENL